MIKIVHIDDVRSFACRRHAGSATYESLVRPIIDAVRKEEHRRLMKDDIDVLKGSKYLWLSAAENVPEKRAHLFNTCAAQTLKRTWIISPSQMT